MIRMKSIVSVIWITKWLTDCRPDILQNTEEVPRIEDLRISPLMPLKSESVAGHAEAIFREGRRQLVSESEDFTVFLTE